jgi:hypothetical protein
LKILPLFFRVSTSLLLLFLPYFNYFDKNEPFLTPRACRLMSGEPVVSGKVILKRRTSYIHATLCNPKDCEDLVPEIPKEFLGVNGVVLAARTYKLFLFTEWKIKMRK